MIAELNNYTDPRLGVRESTMAEDLAAFDQLPSLLRIHIAFAHSKLSAESVLAAWRDFMRAQPTYDEMCAWIEMRIEELEELGMEHPTP